jgi:serralysin
MNMVRLRAGASAVALASLVLAGPAFAASMITSAPSQLTPRNNAVVVPLFTIGDTFNGSDRAYNARQDVNYTPVGILDGIGAYRLSAPTGVQSRVRVMVNHELGPTAGYAYQVGGASGSAVSLTGARVSYFDLDWLGGSSFTVSDAGIAINNVFGRNGQLITTANDLGGLGSNATDLARTGFNRFCSSALFEANSFGAGRGLANRLYFMGEETTGGSMWTIDPANGNTYAIPAMPRGAWENAALIDTGRADKVAFLLGDDRSGAPMYLYVGDKNAAAGASFLDRNGLQNGQVFVWVADNGARDASTVNTTGTTVAGRWVQVANRGTPNADVTGDGVADYDSLGFATQAQLDRMAGAGVSTSGGANAFRFSRPEDISVNPNNPRQAILASTGSSVGGDTWGTLYQFDISFDAAGNPTSTPLRVVYDGNRDPLRQIRSPDNVEWTADGYLYINEDRSTTWTGTPNTAEASLLQLDLRTGRILRVAEMNRSAVPSGQIDISATDFGNWETSGVLDISTLLGLTPGTWLITDVQAHSLRGLGTTPDTLFPLSNLNLAEGGQLLLINASRVSEPGTLAVSALGLLAMAHMRRRKAI